MLETIISVAIIIPLIIFCFDFWLSFLVSIVKGKFQIPKTVYLNPNKLPEYQNRGENIVHKIPDEDFKKNE